MGILALVGVLLSILSGFCIVQVENRIYGCPAMADHRVELPTAQGQEAADVISIAVNKSGQTTVSESIQVAGEEVAHHSLLLGSKVGNTCAPIFIDEGYVTGPGHTPLHGLRVLTGGSFLPFDIPLVSSRTTTLLVGHNYAVGGDTPTPSSLQGLTEDNSGDQFTTQAPVAPKH